MDKLYYLGWITAHFQPCPTKTDATRRDVLRGVGGIAIGSGLPTAALANKTNKKRYIIGTAGKAGANAAQNAADKVHHVLNFGNYGMAVAGDFPKKARVALQSRPDVRYIEKDGVVQAIGQTLPWGIDRVDAERARADGYTGANADIAILDTGIDSDHPDLQANLGEGTR